MFQVLGWVGFNHSSNNNQVKKVCLWSNPRLLFNPFRRKRSRRLWSVLGPVGWRRVCVPAAPPRRYVYGTVSARTERAMKTHKIKGPAIWDETLPHPLSQRSWGSCSCCSSQARSPGSSSFSPKHHQLLMSTEMSLFHKTYVTG